MEDTTNIRTVDGVKCFVDPATGVARPLVKPVRQLVDELAERLAAAEERIAKLEAARRV